MRLQGTVLVIEDFRQKHFSDNWSYARTVIFVSVSILDEESAHFNIQVSYAQYRH